MASSKETVELPLFNLNTVKPGQSISHDCSTDSRLNCKLKSPFIPTALLFQLYYCNLGLQRMKTISVIYIKHNSLNPNIIQYYTN